MLCFDRWFDWLIDMLLMSVVLSLTDRSKIERKKIFEMFSTWRRSYGHPWSPGRLRYSVMSGKPTPKCWNVPTNFTFSSTRQWFGGSSFFLVLNVQCPKQSVTNFKSCFLCSLCRKKSTSICPRWFVGLAPWSFTRTTLAIDGASPPLSKCDQFSTGLLIFFIFLIFFSFILFSFFFIYSYFFFIFFYFFFLRNESWNVCIHEALRFGSCRVCCWTGSPKRWHRRKWSTSWTGNTQWPLIC